MSEETLQSEFRLWLDNLDQSTKNVSTVLETKPVNTEALTDAFDDMQVDARQLEVFRPKSKKILPYDFKPALVLLATAKRLTAKVYRVLKIEDVSVTQSETTSPKPSTYKLPKLDIPKFSGDYAKYYEFIQMFEQAVHDTNLTAVQKFTYLKTYLTGEAEKQIAGLPVTEEYYDYARQLLKEKYGNEKIIIQRLYDKLKIIPTATKALSSIKMTYEALEPPLRMLKQLGEDTDASMLLYNLIVSKYSSETLLPFKQSISTVSELQNTIREIVLFSEKLTPSSSNPQPYNETTTTATLSVISQRPNQNAPIRTPSRKCPFCSKEGHWADECSEYKTTTERKAKIRGVCFVCLRPNHAQKDCRSTIPCAHCKEAKKHHRSLCPKKFGFPEKSKSPYHADKSSSPSTPCTSENVQPKTTTNSSPSETTKPATTVLTAGEQGTFLTIMTTIKNPTTNEKMAGRLILDCCSSHSYILESTARNLNLPKYSEDTFNIKKFQGESKQMKTSQTEFELIPPQGSAIKIHANTTPTIIDSVSTISIDSFCEKYPQYKDLNYADNGEGKEIQILIGGDYFCKILTFQHIEVDSDIDLLHTLFGWLIAGKMKKENINTPILLTTAHNIERIWSLDQIGISTDSLNEEENERKALQNFYENVEVKDGRYAVSWPWKQYPPNLPDNYGLAVGRLRSFLRAYRDSPELLKKYDEIFREQERTGIIERVTEDNIITTNPTHYLPHHPVINEQKSTEIRSVFDASAKTSKQNKSLNDCIYKGKLFLVHIAKILIRMRVKLNLLLADIEKFFHQILLKEKDRDVVRFLWLIDILKPFSPDNIKILRFCRTPFGVIASLFLSLATIYYHFMTKKPTYLKIIQKELYSDNLVTGTETVTEAIQVYYDLKNEFQQMSMNLRKWASNNPEIENQIPIEDLDSSPIINVLGIQWCKKEDTLSIKSTSIPNNAVTKRAILSANNSVFDPLGLVAPVLLPAKLLLKRVTEDKYEWDEKLPQNIVNEWLSIKTELEKTQLIKIPRYISTKGKVSLHVFVDASVAAFGVAVYLRAEAGQIVNVNLLFAKARITPQRPLSVPKLELIAMVLGVRCLQFVITALEFDCIEKHVWSDSKCVLSWIETSKVLPVFVTQRIKEIHSLPNLQFHYVPTTENPADLATRGTSVQALKDSCWFQGPAWLKKTNTNKWPHPSPPISTQDVDVLQFTTDVQVLVTKTENTTPFEIDLNKYSSYSKLRKITVTCIRAMWKLLHRFSHGKIIRTINESVYTYAERLWIKYIQSDISAPPHLNPFVDNNGIIRCAGRLTNVTQMTYEERNPIFLPAKSYFTKLLILYYHSRMYHVGTQHTLSEIRKQFWIPKGRQVVYNVLQKCFDCRKLRNKPYRAPPMPPLPTQRVERVIPFTNSGIDILGPLFTKSNENVQQKRWVIIITCLVTRAIHLEVMENITAEEVLNALRLFISIRGSPAFMISDNAPQFKLLNDFFSAQWQRAIQDRSFTSYIQEKNIAWKWIPQLAPWMGGAYERLIRQVKEAFKTTFRGRILNDKELKIAVYEIAAVLNSRPLTYVGADLNEQILTPNKFLFAEFPGLPSHAEILAGSVTNENVQQGWKKAQRILDQFWSLFSNIYLQSLRDRRNTLKQHRPDINLLPKTGTIVMLADEPTKRGQWKLARIEKLLESADGAIRSVQLTLPNGQSTIRPIVKLIPLELPLEDVERRLPQTTQPISPQINQNETNDAFDFEIDEITVHEVDDSE